MRINTEVTHPDDFLILRDEPTQPTVTFAIYDTPAILVTMPATMIPYLIERLTLAKDGKATIQDSESETSGEGSENGESSSK